MPRYMLLIYGDPEKSPKEGTPEWDAELKQWFTYTEDLEKAGVLSAQSGAALQPATTATTVAVRNGERVVTDGPFADTKEWLGGFYMVEEPDLDAALNHAALMPHVHYGSVEVRPVMNFG